MKKLQSMIKNLTILSIIFCILISFISITPKRVMAVDTYYVYGKYNTNTSVNWYAVETIYPPVYGSFPGQGYSGYTIEGAHSFTLAGTQGTATSTVPVYIIWTDTNHYPYTDEWLVKLLWDGEAYAQTWYYGQSQTVYSQGSYISNVQAVDGTYPANGRGSDGYWYVKGTAVPTINLTTSNNQSLTEQAGNNALAVTGTVQDINNGDVLSVKYTINGLSNHNSITASTLTANGTDQSFSYNITINNTIPEGTYTLRVWVEDNHGGKSEEVLRNFTVDKSAIGANGSPALCVVTSEGKAFNVDANTGSYTDVTSSFLVNNIGTGKPFYVWNETYSFSNTDSAIYDNGSIMTYIGNNTFRAVTSEGKAFDVNKDTGAYADVTSTFLVNNFGTGKPFYNRINKMKVNGSGPYYFYDFGTTMACIGNNKIRVVTLEGKAFDVDKNTGAYTDVTSTFLVNNFGTGKPFYLRQYSYTIGGDTKTFYDWASSMAYIGNNTLRVVTSEGKAFDVNVNNGSYTEVTSTFLVNNFGVGKPFYHRTYNVNINGSSYQFHDWGCTFAYIQDNNPNLTITTPQAEEAFDTITLTGTVSDKNNNNVEITATINGVSPTQTYIATNTATSQTWTLTWNTGTGGVADGKYSDIAVNARDIVTNEITTTIYTGSINVFGANSGYTRKTVVYQYDDNGKLINRFLVNCP